mgnify:CR=1 FL=1
MTVAMMTMMLSSFHEKSEWEIMTIGLGMSMMMFSPLSKASREILFLLLLFRYDIFNFEKIMLMLN